MCDDEKCRLSCRAESIKVNVISQLKSHGDSKKWRGRCADSPIEASTVCKEEVNVILLDRQDCFKASSMCASGACMGSLSVVKCYVYGAQLTRPQNGVKTEKRPLA